MMLSTYSCISPLKNNFVFFTHLKTWVVILYYWVLCILRYKSFTRHMIWKMFLWLVLYFLDGCALKHKVFTFDEIFACTFGVLSKKLSLNPSLHYFILSCFTSYICVFVPFRVNILHVYIQLIPALFVESRKDTFLNICFLWRRERTRVLSRNCKLLIT